MTEVIIVIMLIIMVLLLGFMCSLPILIPIFVIGTVYFKEKQILKERLNKIK